MSEGVAKRLFGHVPYLVATEALRRTQREIDGDVGEPKIAVDDERLAVERFDLGLDLRGRAEDMAVVLGEGAHAHDAVERPGRLIAVARAEFAIPQRQVTVAPEPRVEDLDVAGTVHRLHRVLAVLG